MALTEEQLADVVATVSTRLHGTILGREARAGSAVESEIAGAAVVFCNDVAPNAPEAILREASIRLAGWLYGNRPHVSEHEWSDPSGTTIKLRFNNSAATANGFRSSGASALLSRYIVRRGGVIGGASSSAIAALRPFRAAQAHDVGTSVMRCGFTTGLPFADNNFRWIGTANGVELDSTWNQPAAFAFWLPNDLMERVISIVLLRSIIANPPQVVVDFAAFGPAEAYTFGRTIGQIRYTPITFNGNFSQPNDFRAIIGEPR